MVRFLSRYIEQPIWSVVRTLADQIGERLDRLLTSLQSAQTL